jgi:hypothetical protein
VIQQGYDSYNYAPREGYMRRGYYDGGTMTMVLASASAWRRPALVTFLEKRKKGCGGICGPSGFFRRPKVSRIINHG